VVVIGGFAAADAIRGKPRAEAQPATTTRTVPVQTTPSRLPGPQPQPQAPLGWPEGVLEGTLTFADAETCDIRQIGLAGGRERPLAHFGGDCSLWAPPVGSRVAYGLGPSSQDGLQPFRIADLAAPNRELGGYRALFGVVIWSQDGQHVAWCGRSRVGFDLEVGGPSRRLPRCPAAYTPDGRIAYAVGNRLLIEDTTVLRTDGGITYATFTENGDAAVVVDGKRLELWRGNKELFALALPPRLQGKTPVISPLGCAAFFRLNQPPVGGLEVRDLGCLGGPKVRFIGGRDGAWSPNGEWLASAEPDAIVFHRLIGPQASFSWPAHAAQIVWRPQ
jgi:hypothetical protein